MFIIKKDDKYWNGKAWVTEWKEGILYNSIAAALSQAPDRTSNVTKLDRSQLEEYQLAIEGLETEVN
jgi:hypothetical protein